MSNNPALLIAKDPILKCVISTKELGPILVESNSLPNIDKPCISSLALIDVEQLTSVTSLPADRGSSFHSFIPTADEFTVEASIMESSVSIFHNNQNEIGDNGGDTQRNNEQALQSGRKSNYFSSGKIQTIIDEIQCLRGLQERLLDASMTFSNDNDDEGSMKLFLSRSEKIVDELISTLHQYRLRKKHELKGRKRPRSDIGLSDALCFQFERSIEYYRSLYEQCLEVEKLLEQLSNNNTNTLDMNEELTKVNIIYNDEDNRSHELVMELSNDFPAEFPILTTDFPVEFNAVYLKGEKETYEKNDVSNEIFEIATSTKLILPSIFGSFATMISKLQPFWREMDDIDSNCLVLEPSLPARRSCVERRIALSETISIYLEFDPQSPQSPPLSMRLSGTSEETLQLRKTYQNYVIGREREEGDVKESNESSWDDQKNVRSNLEECFDLSLPSPVTDQNLDFNNECGICYSYRLFTEGEDDKQDHLIENDVYPNILCRNPSCGRKFHKSCLLEWLQSLPNAKVSFDRIHGTCMYCCEPISVRTSGLK